MRSLDQFLCRCVKYVGTTVVLRQQLDGVLSVLLGPFFTAVRRETRYLLV